MENGLESHIRQYQSFLDTVDPGHREAKTRRDYVNNKQWTSKEIETLRRRRQPVITDNQIKRKTDYFSGIERQTRTDPKCFPRTPQDEDSAEAFTDALRFVCDNSEWDVERSEGFDNLVVEGMEGHIVVAEQTPRDIEIRIRHIPWDRIIYDPHSRDRYFRDASYKGVVTWMDRDAAIAMFPDKADIIRASFADRDDGTVFADRPSKAVWVDRKGDRVKLIQLYYIESGVWMHCIFTCGGYLIEPEQSQYLDEFGRPDCPIELAGAYVDSDNDRFGMVQEMISLQDMTNKLESKLMHFTQANQTWGNSKVRDTNALKAEAKKPDGHFDLTGDAKFGEDFGIVNTDNKVIGVQNLLTEISGSLAQIGGNSIQAASASGRSKEIDQQTKAIELGPVLDTHRQHSKRVYRQAYNRIKQYYTAPKWVRVTDDENNIRWAQLNQPVTFRELLQEKFGDDWEMRVPMAYRGQIDQVAEIRNNTAEVDMDIIVEDAPDIVNIQQEQFAVLVKLAETYGPDHVPFEEVLRLSSLRGKESFIDRTKGDEQARQQMAAQEQQKREQAYQLGIEKEVAELMETKSKVALNMAKAEETLANEEKTDLEAEQLEIENELAVASVERFAPA